MASRGGISQDIGGITKGVSVRQRRVSYRPRHPWSGHSPRGRRSRAGGRGGRRSGAIIRAQSRAWAVSVIPGKSRRSSTAAANSPPWSKAARTAAASASETLNIAGACAIGRDGATRNRRRSRPGRPARNLVQHPAHETARICSTRPRHDDARRDCRPAHHARSGVQSLRSSRPALRQAAAGRAWASAAGAGAPPDRGGRLPADDGGADSRRVRGALPPAFATGGITWSVTRSSRGRLGGNLAFALRPRAIELTSYRALY